MVPRCTYTTTELDDGSSCFDFETSVAAVGTVVVANQICKK